MMTIDVEMTKVGETAAKVMDSIKGDDLERIGIVKAEVGDVVVVAEMTFEDDDGAVWSEFYIRGSDKRNWVLQKLLEVGSDALVEESTADIEDD